ncbi:hypothetical protein AKG43_03400 [Neisseria sp. 74A18]|nr:hypothetical protein AKG43_03400 [Neisseria sp. 74A18]
MCVCLGVAVCHPFFLPMPFQNSCFSAKPSRTIKKHQAEAFAKPSDVDAVQVAAQRVQTYHIDRQTSEQRTTQKCAADGGFTKVSGRLNSQNGLMFLKLP